MMLTRAEFQRTSLELQNKIEKQFSEIMAALNGSRDDELCDDRSPLDRYSPSSQKVKGSGSEGWERSLNEEELVETEVATEPIETKHGIVKPETNANMILANLEEESMPQFQCDHQKSISQVSHVKEMEEFPHQSTNGNGENVAHQVFGKMSQQETLGIKKKTKGFKSWRFKFKQRVATRESKSGFEVNMKHNQSKEYPCLFLAGNVATLGHILFESEMKFNGCRMFLQLLRNVIRKKRQRKAPKYHKSWKFRFKNMELQRIMTQLDTQHFIFRWDSECILHLSTVVHHLETLHKQSSFAIDALKSDFGFDVIIFHGEQQFGSRVVMLHLKKRGTYEFSGQLQDSSNVEAESFPFLNFAAEQPLLWMQNNAEPILIVSELEREKKKLCYKTWMFKYKAPLKRVQFLHYCDKEVPKETNWAVQRIWDKDSPEVDIIDAYSVLQDVSEMVNKQLLKTSLVIQQVMRNKKIKFSKRWWFKYKYVEVGVKRLHNQLRYKCLLELEERFKIWSRRESWRKHKEVQQFMATKEEMEVGMKENDQKQRGDWGHYFLLLAAANWSPQMHLWSTSYRVWHRWKARWFLVRMISTMRAWLFGEEGFDIGKEMRRGHMK